MFKNLIKFLFFYILTNVTFCNTITHRNVSLRDHHKNNTQNNKEETEYTLPDLHGNTLKLLKALIELRYIDITKENYNVIVKNYFTVYEKMTHQNVNEVKQAIKSMKVLKKGKKNLLRLIGDEFCDRGLNDYYTLLLISYICKENIACEIILSNHSFEFIKAYETKTFMPKMELPFSLSLVILKIMIEKHLVTEKEVIDLINNYYKPNLKLVSYSLSKDKNAIYIYTHAPIGIDDLKKLSHDFGINFQDKTPHELAKTIDTLNEVFQKMYVIKNKVHTVFEKVEFLIWNRDYSNLKRPNVYNNYHLFFIHGHDGTKNTKDNIFNLDANNELGKDFKLNKGTLNIFEFKK